MNVISELGWKFGEKRGEILENEGVEGVFIDGVGFVCWIVRKVIGN